MGSNALPYPLSLRLEHLAQRCAHAADSEDEGPNSLIYLLAGKDDTEVVAYVDKNPFRQDPYARTQLFARIKCKLRRLGIKELARAGWPSEDARVGNYVGLLYDARGDEGLARVSRAIQAELDHLAQDLIRALREG
jgi:hypothetical protein